MTTNTISETGRLLARTINVGLNLGGPRDDHWCIEVSGAELDAIRQAGFTAIRLGMQWAAQPAVSCTDKLSRIAETLQKGTDVEFRNDPRIDFEPDGLHLRGSAQLAIGGKEIFKFTLG